MMKTTAVAFIFGAAIGASISWYYAKSRYERIAQEEIDSVKEVFSKKRSNSIDNNPDNLKAKVTEESKNPSIEKPDMMEYVTQIKSEKYVDYSSKNALKQESNVNDSVKRPYVIPPDSFGEFDDYSTISFMYYADHILADEMDQPVENVEELIGFESLTHFGEYDDDSVYVRNDLRKTDYEILRSLRTYSEIIEENPYKAEV